jgi:hypothetical protein
MEYGVGRGLGHGQDEVVGERGAETIRGRSFAQERADPEQ